VKHFTKTRIYQLFADNCQFSRTVFTTGVQNLAFVNPNSGTSKTANEHCLPSSNAARRGTCSGVTQACLTLKLKTDSTGAEIGSVKKSPFVLGVPYIEIPLQ